jgi:hypothetical protein
VTSGASDGEKIFLRDQVLEGATSRAGCTSPASPRRHDEWDPPIPAYDPPTPPAPITAIRTVSVPAVILCSTLNAGAANWTFA